MVNPIAERPPQINAGAAAPRMKAAICTAYGSPDVVQIWDVEKPAPKDDEVLIKVRAASLNPADWHIKRGQPRLVRLITGLGKPRDGRIGFDVAGEIETVGRNVTEFKPGDEVFGSCQGAFAEYACALESAVARKPENVTFEQAAAVPIAAYTALQGLRDKGKVQPAQKVLIHGASGGVGTFAVQIAKWLGAEVTAVCSTRNVDLVRSIGADRVVDYTQRDFTKDGQRYDVIFDLVGNHSLTAVTGVLNRKGIYIGAGILGSSASLFGMLTGMIATLVRSRFMSQQVVIFMAKRRKEDLLLLHELLKTGKVTPVIDKCYSLSQVPEAIRHLEGKHARGKIVIAVADPHNN
jgi:NADPH:quinone reductase-like Zn-dependent oxidoreductase